MARGESQSVDARVHDALDVCLGRLRSGDDLDTCLAGYADLADQLRPLLLLAGSLQSDTIDPPEPPSGLSAPRERLMAAARSALGTTERSSSGADAQAEQLISPATDTALDVCLARIRSGEDVARVVADFPEYETDLLPILELAGHMLSDVPVPPPPPQGLEAARQRFLSTAERLSASSQAQDEAVDAAIALALSGDAVGASEALSTEGAEELQPLAELAAQMVADRVTVPPPPSGLAMARQRFVAAADAQRAATAAAVHGTPDARAVEEGSLLDRLAALLSPARPTAMPRVAALAVAVLLAMVVGATSLSQSVEAAIPGDALYPVKRMGEEVRLALVRDDDQRQALQALLSARRDSEIEAATAAGVVADVSWQVRLDGIDGDGPDRRLLVSVLTTEDGGRAIRQVGISPDTVWLLGEAFREITDVPAGSLLGIVVRTRPSDPGGWPLAIRVELLDSPQVEIATAEHEPEDRAFTVIEREASVTPATPAPSATTIATLVPATPTRLTVATPTQTLALATMTPTTAPAVVKEATRDRAEGVLRGLLSKRVDDATWSVADIDQGGAVVTVDIRQLPASQTEDVRTGDGVDLDGRWLSPDHRKFRAEELLLHEPEAEVCIEQSATGTVEDYKPGSFLLLTDNREFLMGSISEDAVGGVAPLEIGAEVLVKYLDCRGIKKVIAITVLRGAGGPARGTGTARPPGVPYQGTVERVVEPGEFMMLGDDGHLYTVLYGPDTPITGAASEIRWQQEVGVIGWLEGSQITAQSIEVYADAPPTATPQPTATPTTGAMGPPVTPPSVPTVTLPKGETG
jgi:hypothetical protein